MYTHGQRGRELALVAKRCSPAIATAIGIMALLSGCAVPGPPPAPEDSPTGSPASGGVSTPPDAAPGPAQRPANLTCESLLAPEVAAVLAETGWTAEEEPFRIGTYEIDEGLWCVWGAPDTATASVQIYGWAAVEADEAARAQAELTADGWIIEMAQDGVYVTENPDSAIAIGADGYGMTFLFRDGGVIFSDVRERLPVIQPPG